MTAIATEEDQIKLVNADFTEENDQLEQEDVALQEKERLLSEQQVGVGNIIVVVMATHIFL